MNGDRHHNGRISTWLIRQTSKRRTRMGMHDPSSDEYRPYIPNEATPTPAPVIHAADIQAAVEAGAMEPSEITPVEGDGDWAVEATEHVEAATPDEDGSPGFESATPDGKDDYGNPERHRGEPFERPGDGPGSDFSVKEDTINDHADFRYGDPTAVRNLPDENGADLEDADPGFIPEDDDRG